MDDLKEHFKKAIDLLTPLEQQVMKLRFGIDGSPVYEIEEIATELGFAIEELREAETAARQKLEQHKRQQENS